MKTFQQNFKRDFEEWNKKPFDTKEFLMIQEPYKRSKHTEIALKILILNEYLSTRLQREITAEGFANFLEDELNKMSINIPDSEMKNLTVALLNLSGIYAYYVILGKPNLIKAIDFIQTYESIEESEKINLEKIEKALDRMKLLKADLVKASDNNKVNELLFEQAKIIINNKGESFIIYYLIGEWFEIAKQKLNVSKYKLCELLSECFYFFEFINKRARLTYPNSLYKQLNRIKNKKEKINSLNELFKQFRVDFPTL